MVPSVHPCPDQLPATPQQEIVSLSLSLSLSLSHTHTHTPHTSHWNRYHPPLSTHSPSHAWVGPSPLHYTQPPSPRTEQWRINTRQHMWSPAVQWSPPTPACMPACQALLPWRDHRCIKLLNIEHAACHVTKNIHYSSPEMPTQERE